jgi:hypothetical protein
MIRRESENPGYFRRDLKTLTGINQWPNSVVIVLGGQRWETAWTLSGDSPDGIPTQEIHSQNKPGLPIRRVGRINFMQKRGYFHTRYTGKAFCGTIRGIRAISKEI